MGEGTRATDTAGAEAGGRRPGRSWHARPWLRRTLLGAVALLVLLVLFCQLALPGIVRAQAERIVAEKLHRQLHIDQVEIHPFTLGVSVIGLHLMEADGRAVFVSFDRLDTRLSAASLLHLAPVVRELRLLRPYVHFARTAPNRYSTDDIVAALAAGPKEPPPPPDAPPARFSVNNIQVEGGHFVFDDAPKADRHEVTDFTLGLPFVSSFASAEEIFVEPQLSARIDGAPLRLTGQALPFAPTREAALDLDLDGIDLTRYLDYLPAPPPVRIAHANLDVHLKLKAQLPKGEAPRLGVAGTVTLKALAIQSPDGKPLLALDEVALAVDRAAIPAGPLAASVMVNHRGRLSVEGDTALAPLHAALAVQVQDLDLLPLQPLFADRVNLRVTQASLAAKGKLQLDQAAGAAARGGFQGEVALQHLATVDSLNGNDFIKWDALALRGIDVRLAPLALHVDTLALDGLYARVIVSPEGRINLQDIVKQKSQAKISLTEAAAAPAAPPAPDRGPAGASPPAPAAVAASGPPVSIGQVLVKAGHVRFSDNFIKPRYGADLMDLNGSVTGLSSDPASTAAVDLHGKVNDAPLLIGGRVNPLRRDLSLDIKASVHDMELAPLSPYATKYVGYRIERGKLSFDVAYRLENRQLTASNRLVLDQLTFGDKVDSPSATSLPVQLAVALLKDRNGVIDIDLPIGGSLDDPQFSVGGVIVRVLVNLVTKAVTAPFALLGSLFGGGDEQLSTLDFDPGSIAVPPQREGRLKALAKAMAERPGLKLDITGWADPRADREALRAQWVDARLRALKRQDLGARGELPAGGNVVVAPAEYPELLARAFRLDVAAAAASAPKPAAASPSAPPTQADMEKALRAAQQVTDDDLRALGNKRAQAAKQWMATIGLVAPERLSVVDARIAPAPADAGAASEGTAAGGAKPAPAASRVEFGLR